MIENKRYQQDQESLEEEAMDSFAKAAYPEASTQFMQLADETSSSKIAKQAQFGAVLSDILSAGTLADIQGPEDEFEKHLLQSSHDMSIYMRLLRPFIQIKREHIVFQEENRDVHSEIKAARNKIQALEEEKKDLLRQIQELEELFNLIEQKKRRFLLNSQ